MKVSQVGPMYIPNDFCVHACTHGCQNVKRASVLDLIPQATYIQSE